MHILVLCKRQYTGRDLLDDRYGRLYEIPEQLALAGHEVTGRVISYRRRGALRTCSPAGVSWHSTDLLSGGFIPVSRAIRADALPDVIWAGSDIPMCLFGMRLGRQLGVPVVLDLYDNYEAFGLARIPGMAAAFRRACSDASGLTVVTQALADYLASQHGRRLPITVVGNGVNTDVFRPLERDASRAALGLPLGIPLIGCAGALDQSRGIDDLFQAFMQLSTRHADLHLVIAGPRDATPERYHHPRIIDLGVLDWKRVPALISSLDVSIACNRDSAFGRFCYPLKVAESLQCGVPVVAAAVGDVPLLLDHRRELLYAPGDAAMLAARIEDLLAAREATRSASAPAGWEHIAPIVQAALLAATRLS